MKITYLAKVRKTKDGWYAIDFPDLPGTHARCAKLMEMKPEAEYSLWDYLIAAQSTGTEVNPPSKSVLATAGDRIIAVTVNI